jgi:hypothetical protein
VLPLDDDDDDDVLLNEIHFQIKHPIVIAYSEEVDTGVY